MADKKDWQRLFEEVDKNKNGFLTASEIAKEMINIGYPGTESKIKAFLCSADSSGDRHLSKEEFMAAMEEAPTEFQIAALLHTVFNMFDISGDGHISKTELNRALKKIGRDLKEEELDDLFNKIDTDCSGTINIKEFLSAVRKRLL